MISIIKNSIRACLEKVRDPIYRDDTFLVSYPKSGNTWVRFIFSNLLSCGAEQIDFNTSLNYVPNFESRELSRKLARPRILKSHAVYNSRFRNVIYIVRDPRDVYLSFYHYRKGHLPEGATFSDFIRSDWMFPGKWHEHVNAWTKKKTCLCVIRYEDLLINPVSELKKAIQLCPSLHFTEEQIKIAVQKSSFQEMKRLELSKGRPFQSEDDRKKATPFMRKGESGNWREEYSKDDLDYVERLSMSAMEEWGYKSELVL